MDQPMVALSVVVPIYNEQATLSLLVDRLRPVLDGLDEPYEVVAVDDGSTDATPAILTGIRPSWPQLRVVRLSRNCGHQAALSAGLFRARGAYVASIDADLQDPPEKIPDMFRLAQRDGLDVVYGVRTDRTSDTWFKRSTAAAYYRLMRRLVGGHVPADAGDFRVLSRHAVTMLRSLPERSPVLRLMVPWLGLPSGEVTYVRERRVAGRTKYPLPKMIMLASDSITSFSAAPLRVATWLGLAGIGLCVLLAFVAFGAFVADATVSGWASVYIAVLFLGAVQLLCLGLLGEYVARIFTEVQKRPAYFVGSDTADGDGPAGTGGMAGGTGADPGATGTGSDEHPAAAAPAADANAPVLASQGANRGEAR